MQGPQAPEVDLDSAAAAEWCVTNFSLLGALARGEAPDRAAGGDQLRAPGRWSAALARLYELVEAAGQLTGLAASADAASRCREATAHFDVFACASGDWPVIRVRGGASTAADQMFGGVRLALFWNAACARAAARAPVADGKSRITAGEPLRRARLAASMHDCEPG